MSSNFLIASVLVCNPDFSLAILVSDLSMRRAHFTLNVPWCTVATSSSIAAGGQQDSSRQGGTVHESKYGNACE
jgi:meiotically up-regulated gene 157 (Mug157) protein